VLSETTGRDGLLTVDLGIILAESGGVLKLVLLEVDTQCG
jgi:hypothetical protein